MTFSIENRLIGSEYPVYLIAEIGMNHNGDIDRAIALVDIALESGADCAKFQMRDLNEVYRARTLQRSGEDLSTEYTLDLLERFELSIEEHRRLADYCKHKGILYLCTPWDPNSVQRLEEVGVSAYKIASADLTNQFLLEKVCNTGRPIILSTGMSNTAEIQNTVRFLRSRNASFALLHCNSTYPAPLRDINLSYLRKLAEFCPTIGYSGHERGIAVSIAAVAMGAQIIERHLTLDRNMEGPDHAASLEPADFKALVNGIREVEEAIGSGEDREISQGEMMNRENLAKSLVAARPLKKGDILQAEDLKARSPGQGLAPQRANELIGRKLGRDMGTEDYFFESDLRDVFIQVGNYQFSRPWGIPIRYHDFDAFASIIKPDIFEFHLSYTDMELNIDDYLHGTYPFGFVVHAPELFANSHLLDLATPEDEYRNISVREMARVVAITRSLKRFFPGTNRPMIVANVGGISRDANLPADVIPEYYNRYFETLRKDIDLEGVEIIPQTMAPFPWHFGGQRYQNMFVMPEEIAEQCKRHCIRICLDVSHSKLTCNHFGIDFYEFVRVVGPYTAHLHIGDSKGVNGEGLQIGEGEIDFVKLANILAELAPGASFIPEIWQGHKNNGEGFWIALDRLKGVF